MRVLATSLVLASVLALALAGNACPSPKVDVKTYTPSDAQVLSHIPYVAEFTLTCSGGAAGDVALYADVAGSLVPVMRSVDDNKYQIGWTKEVKHAKTGDHVVKLYDEEGYAAVKRVLERGDDTSSVQPLATVTINYPGAYNGPWVNSELVALVLAILVFYLAFSSKNALLA